MATVQEVQNDIYECRIKLLKQMNDYVCNVIGDEDAWSDWITIGVPDEATEDDYEFIAHDQDEWSRICGVFGTLIEVFQS